MSTDENGTAAKQKFLSDSIKSNNLSRKNFMEYIKDKKENGGLTSAGHRQLDHRRAAESH